MSHHTHQHVYRFAGSEAIRSRICTGTQERFVCTVAGCGHVRLVMTAEGDAGLTLSIEHKPAATIPPFKP